MKSASESGDDDDDGSDEDVSDEDEGFKRATWGGSKTSGKNGDRFGNKGSRKKEGDMEVTFHAGLEEFGARMKRKKELGGRTESVWEQEERRRKERRDERKAGKKTDKAAGGSDSDGGDGDDGDASGFSDPFFDGEGADEGDIDWDGMGGESDDEIGEKTATRGKKSKGSKRSVDDDDDDEDRFKLDKESKKQKKRRERGDADDPDAARERADLELLMMNDDEVRGVHSGAGILGKKSKKQAAATRTTSRRAANRARRGSRRSASPAVKPRGARSRMTRTMRPRTAAGRARTWTRATVGSLVSSSRITSPWIPPIRGIRRSRLRTSSSRRGTGGAGRRMRRPSARRGLTMRERGRRPRRGASRRIWSYRRWSRG